MLLDILLDDDHITQFSEQSLKIYTAREMGFGADEINTIDSVDGAGTNNWCQEEGTAENLRVIRGFTDSPTYFALRPSDLSGVSLSEMIGWRPVLELIP